MYARWEVAIFVWLRDFRACMCVVVGVVMCLVHNKASRSMSPVVAWRSEVDMQCRSACPAFHSLTSQHKPDLHYDCLRRYSRGL